MVQLYQCKYLGIIYNYYSVMSVQRHCGEPYISDKFVFLLQLSQFLHEMFSDCRSVFTQSVFLNCIKNSESSCTRHRVASILHALHTHKSLSALKTFQFRQPINIFWLGFIQSLISFNTNYDVLFCKFSIQLIFLFQLSLGLLLSHVVLMFLL